MLNTRNRMGDSTTFEAASFERREGDLVLKPGQDEILVWVEDHNLSRWVTCNAPFHETSEAFFRRKFQDEENELHKRHPQLKTLRDEYKIMKKLLEG